ncbi:MAG: AAA family ATPase [Cyanobacteria bacterium J06639_1]
MARIKRDRKVNKGGEEVTYLRAVDGGKRTSQAIAKPSQRQRSSAIARIPSGKSSDSPPCYREREKNRIIASLQAGSSLLVVGDGGCGKTFLARLVAAELEEAGFAVALLRPTTVKDFIGRLAVAFDIDMENLEGKKRASPELQVAIAEHLAEHRCFVIIDSAHRLQVALRVWLDDLLEQRQPMLLFATHPPARDLFMKLPRLELKPLDDDSIRDLMETTGGELSLEMTPARLARLQQRSGGNPMLARRIVDEERLGLEPNGPDHTRWIDGTPFLVAILVCFVVVRVVGLGLNNTNLYLLGAIAAGGATAVRLLVGRIPQRRSKL